MKLNEIKKLIVNELTLYNKNIAECNDILQIALNKPMSEILLLDNLSDMQVKKIKKVLKKRVMGVPFDKILGYTDFCGVKIEFSKHVLSPRKETELLCNMIVDYVGNRNLCVLDLCAGSGAIGLGIKKNCLCDVMLADISKYAIKEIKKNAQNNQLKVGVIRSDMFLSVQEKYDIIVCNPPYINSIDMKSLEIEVKKYDPKIALFGGFDGCDFYRNIAENFATFMKPDGKLYLEIGYGQSQSIKEIFKNYNVEIKRDFSNIERFVIVSILGE